jgi:hypothetical protein
MRINRKAIPKEVKSKLTKGQTVGMFWKKIMVLKWKDKKDVVMISTLHDSSMTATKMGPLEKPKCVLDYYNANMSGVDVSDYFIRHRFRPIVRLYFLDYGDNLIIRRVGFSDVFNPIAKVIKQILLSNDTI